MNAERAFRILWGPNLENQLDFTYPVVGSAPIFARSPRAGSVVIPNGAGATAWITGRYYRLTVQAQYFGYPQNFGATGLQAFIDWAADSNAFTLMPNIALPTLTVTGCYLEGPFTQLNPTLEQDTTQTLQLTILHPTVDLGVAWRGLFFEYAAGQSLTDPVRATYSRSSVGYEITPAGYLLSHPTDSICDGHYPGGIAGSGLQTTLLEMAVVNDIANPEAINLWPVLINVSVTSNNAKAPDQNVTADLIVESAAASVVHTAGSASWTIAASDPVTVIAFVRNGGRHRGGVYITDTATNLIQNGGNYDLSTGTITPVVSGTGSSQAYLKMTQLAGGWYMIQWRGVLDNATTSVRFFCQTADSSGNASYTGDGASGVYLWGATAVHGAAKSVASYTPTTSVADSLSAPWLYVPQAGWFYVKFVESGMAQTTGYPSLIAISNAGGATPIMRFFSEKTNGQATYGFTHWNTVNAECNPITAPVQGDTVEVLGLIFADGSTQERLSINGGAEIINTNVTTQPFAAAWSGATIWLCSSGGATGNAGIASVKAGPGVSVNTIAQARFQ